MIKFNVDAAFDSVLSHAVVAVIVRDSGGALLTGTSCRFSCGNVDRAEAEALLEAVRFATSLDIKNPMFEGDNLQVIRACNGLSPIWKASTAVNEIKHLCGNFSNFSFNWVPRKANKVADLVAGLVLKRFLSLFWTWMPPENLRAAILSDIVDV